MLMDHRPTDVDETNDEDYETDDEDDETDDEDDLNVVELLHSKPFLDMVNNMTNSTQKELILNSLRNSTLFANETTSYVPIYMSLHLQS